jgi:C4-dicarboxylate-specific signal transduction histidine kinase
MIERLVAVVKHKYELRNRKVPTTRRASEALLEERLTFERLLADLSARFANASGDQVEREIESALKQLLEFLDFDRGAIGRFNADGWYSILCSVGTERAEPFPRGPVPSYLSWYFGQLRADKIVSVRSIDDLPPEAIGEIEYYRRSGMRSSLAIPLRVGGHVVGAIAFSAFRPTREWPEDLIVRLKMIGEAIAQALVRKHSEAALRASEAETARLMRQALLGELSGTIAHELNQPLTAILANAETAQHLLSQRNVDLSKIQEIVADIIEQDSRASEVIGRVRKLLRKGENKPEVIHANQLVESTMHLLHGEFIRQKVNIDFVPANNLPMISGDPVQLQQVLLNLIMNAIEAMSAKKPSERVINITTRANEKKVEVAIVDSGTGLPVDDKARLFEPFFTTKQHGLGLGLSICASIIEAHGGALRIENNAGDGATAVVALPTLEPDQFKTSPLSYQS